MITDRAQRIDGIPKRAWMLHAWRTTRWTPPMDLAASAWEQWRHVSTVVLSRDADNQLANGECIWALDEGEEPIGVAWEWTEWRPGVIILKDPMCIVSNLAHDAEPAEQGGYLLSRDIVLNTIARALPWQEEVVRAMEHFDGSIQPVNRRAANHVKLAA